MLLRLVMGNYIHHTLRCLSRTNWGPLWRCFFIHLFTLLLIVIPINSDCQFNLKQYEIRRISALKMQILSKLGLSEEPSYMGPDEIPQEDMELYNTTVALLEEKYMEKQKNCPSAWEAERKYYAKETMLFNLDTSRRDARNDPYFEGRNRFARYFKFDLSALENHPLGADAVTEASFRLYQEPHKTKDMSQTLLFNQLVPTSTDEYFTKKHIFSKTFKTTDEGPFTIDITETVQEWVTNPDSNHGIEVEVLCASHQSSTTNGVSSMYVNFADPRGYPNGHTDRGDMEMMKHSSKEFYPRLIVMTPGNHTGSLYSQSHSRRRRSANEEPMGEGSCRANSHGNCCLRTLYVNFKRDLNWTWVRQPKGFWPNYCAGNCPFIHHDSFIHKHLISRYKQLNPDASPSPCCIPRRLKPISVLYYDEQTFLPKISMIENAIVESCKCA